jgi:hypothetical protein
MVLVLLAGSAFLLLALMPAEILGPYFQSAEERKAI